MTPRRPISNPSTLLRTSLQAPITNYHLPITLIIILAAILRLGWLNLTEFKADEARLYLLALDMAEFKSFALRGIGSSVGIPNFPISVWLFSIPLFIWKHPYSATLFVGLLNTVAVYLTYRLTKKYWSETAALVAALMFAVSPWAIIYSRKIWAQDLLPLFVLVYIGSALAAFVDKRKWMLLLHFIALAAIAQIHLSGIAFTALTTLWLILFWRRVNWIEVVFGIIGGILIAIPFGIYVLQQPSSNLQSLISNLQSRPSVVDLDSLRYTWMLLIGSDIHSLAGPKAFQDFLNSVPNIDLIRWLWGAMALGGLVAALVRRHDKDVIVAAWLIVPAIFFTRHSTPVFPHYFILTLPAGYIFAGDCLNSVLEFFTAETQRAPSENIKIPSRPSRSGLRGLLFGGIALTAAMQMGIYLALLFFISSVNTPNGFGTPLGMWLDVVDRAKITYAQRGSSEILLVGEGDDPAISEFPVVMDALLRDVPHRFVDGNTAALFPSGSATVIIQPTTINSRAIYEQFSKAEACILLRESEQGVELLSIPKDPQVRLANEFPAPRALANGVELIGWERKDFWMIVWRVGYVPAASEYHFFNHAASAKVDGVSYPSRYWRDGDVAINFFNLNVKEPVRVGMYEYPSVKNVLVMDEAGKPFADAVTATP